MKGRIAVLTKFNEDFEVREYPVPEVEPEAVLVKVTRAGLCGSDLHIWRGELRELFGVPDRGQAWKHRSSERMDATSPALLMLEFKGLVVVCRRRRKRTPLGRQETGLDVLGSLGSDAGVPDDLPWSLTSALG